jgi:hypothetical protein
VAQAVVTAEHAQVIAAPVVVVVVACADLVLVGQVDEPERCRVLEQHAKHVAALQQRPVVITLIAQAAVVGVEQVQLPGVTGCGA